MNRFSRWPSAMICIIIKNDKVLELLKTYISHHGVSRKTYMDQGSNFTPKQKKLFCNTEGIEITYSPVNYHKTTGCVERTIGSLNNFVLAYAKEKDHGKLESLVERTLSAFRFAPNTTLKVTPIEEHHGREAITVLRNLTTKPSLQNLNWAKELKQKSACLDTEDTRANRLPYSTQTSWTERSDNEYDMEHKNTPEGWGTTS